MSDDFDPNPQSIDLKSYIPPLRYFEVELYDEDKPRTITGHQIEVSEGNLVLLTLSVQKIDGMDHPLAHATCVFAAHSWRCYQEDLTMRQLQLAETGMRAN